MVWFFFSRAVAITAMVMVLIAIAQVVINFLQMQEAKTKRIEAEQVLEEVNKVKTKAESVLNEVNQVKAKADDVLMETNKEVSRIASEIQDFGDQLNQTTKRLKSTEQKFTETQQDLNSKVVALKEELSEELKSLKMRNAISLLADNAISTGNAASYDELCDRLWRPQGFYHSIKSEINSVKRFYIRTTRLKSAHLLKDGVQTEPSEFSTNELINDLLNNQKWQVRALIANELGNRKVKGVPEALIKGMIDDNLDVRRNCIKSFEKITGFENPDILDGHYAIKWWYENKEEVEKKLVEQ